MRFWLKSALFASVATLGLTSQLFAAVTPTRTVANQQDALLEQWEDTIPDMMRAMGVAAHNGDASLSPLLIQQYDVCRERVNCAQEIRPETDFASYNRAVTDPYYGYQVFIFIDKARAQVRSPIRDGSRHEPQTMWVWRRDPRTGQFDNRPLLVKPVSTGREPTPIPDHVWVHGKGNTRSGFLRVQNAQARYTARSGEAMPWSLWFESEFGTAIHETTQARCDQAIGQRASAGCVRMCPGHAKLVFDVVAAYDRSTPIVLLHKRNGLPISSGGAYWDGVRDVENTVTMSGGQVTSAPKVISGIPAFVRIMDGSLGENQQELQDIFRNPAQAFRRYFPPVAPGVMRGI